MLYHMQLRQRYAAHAFRSICMQVPIGPNDYQFLREAVAMLYEYLDRSEEEMQAEAGLREGGELVWAMPGKVEEVARLSGEGDGKGLTIRMRKRRLSIFGKGVRSYVQEAYESLRGAAAATATPSLPPFLPPSCPTAPPRTLTTPLLSQTPPHLDAVQQPHRRTHIYIPRPARRAVAQTVASVGRSASLTSSTSSYKRTSRTQDSSEQEYLLLREADPVLQMAVVQDEG
ncbi:hypothetical protein BDZ91DRAFT_795173 [Kalaharituber pfeilii]|nr:hypothetical protein BDZ91DRAFT_795173 [Kalaharituber pfeilii]